MSKRLSILAGGATVAAGVLIPQSAEAYSVKVHIHFANEIRDELIANWEGQGCTEGEDPWCGKPAIRLLGPDDAPTQWVMLDEDNAEAIRDNPEFWRGGAIGPDNTVFPGMTDPSHGWHFFPFSQCQAMLDNAQDGAERAYALGLEHLRRGNYTRAIASFTLAARLNQSDPAARLMLALARLAQGHHVEAAAAFRRAVELQPQLVYLELPLERRFPRHGLLRTFTGRLADWARSHPDQADVRYLLGYLWFRQGRLRDAYAVLQEAARLRPDDRLVRDLLEVARPPAGDAAQSRSE